MMLDTFPDWLKRRRKMLDLTQADLGDRVGCSAATIRKLEAGERKPSQQLAELLGRALQIPEGEKQAFLQVARGISVDALPAISPEAPPAPPENLPAPLTSLVDRVNDVVSIVDLLADPAVRWVTLIGPPGIGKTRLCIQSGRQALGGFEHGAWFVDLSELEDAAFVLPALIRSITALDLPPSASLDQLIPRLKERRMLLILDNFEQVTQAALEIARLLKSCAGLKVLATSRIPLHIYGEHEYPVPPLTIPPAEAAQKPGELMAYEAVQLFVERARQGQRNFSVNPRNAPLLIDICSTLEGMPLALELAAASLQRMTLEEMDAMLHRMPGVNWITQLSTPAIDLPARQRTLENVVAWSYNLLTDSQKALFSDLGVFSGWFDEQAVAEVCLGEDQPTRGGAREMLRSLAEHSLLERGAIGGKACWRMLEVIREYANLTLGAQRRARLEASRACYFLALVRAYLGLDNPQDLTSFFELHGSNLISALKRAISERQAHTGFELAIQLEDLWSSLGYFREGLSLIRQLLALPVEVDPLLRADALQIASDLAWQQHDFDAGLEYARQAAELGTQYGLRGKQAMYLNRLGRIYIERGEYPHARQVLNECLALARAEPDSLNPALPLAQLGELAFFEGKLDEAQAFLEEAITALAPGEVIFTAMATTDLVEIALRRSDTSQARRWLAQAFDATSLHIRRTLVYLCAVAGYLVQTGGEDRRVLMQAARFLGAVEALGEGSGVIFSPFYRELIAQRSASIRDRISPQDWQAGYAEGRRWSRVDALAQARNLV
jgi:predicted ATPase/transcriptional regulator with XRE-family HTH domain